MIQEKLIQESLALLGNRDTNSSLALNVCGMKGERVRDGRETEGEESARANTSHLVDRSVDHTRVPMAA